MLAKHVLWAVGSLYNDQDDGYEENGQHIIKKINNKKKSVLEQAAWVPDITFSQHA